MGTESFITSKHYSDAIEAQNACNLSGLVFSFEKVMGDICKEANRLGMGTDWKNTHPLVRFWLCTLSCLAGNYCASCDEVVCFVYRNSLKLD